MEVKLYGSTRLEHLGYIPTFLSPQNTLSAKEQLDANYAHGGGWNPLKGWKLLEDDRIAYPGDNPLKPLAEMVVGVERVLVYPHAWVAIIQPDRSFEVARMD